MFPPSYIVTLLQRERERLRKYYDGDEERIFVHFAISLVQKQAAHDRGQVPKVDDKVVNEITNAGGSGDKGVDAIWAEPESRTLYVMQVKGSPELLALNVGEMDDDDESPFRRFDGAAVKDLDRALSRFISGDKHSDKFAEANKIYQDAISSNYRVELIPVVFGDKKSSFDEAVRDLNARLNSDRKNRFAQHRVNPLDIGRMSDLLDLQFERKPGFQQISAKDWSIEGKPSDGNGVWIAFAPGTSLVALRQKVGLNLYHANFRFMLRKSSVKKAMIHTIENSRDREIFHLLNNGITILGSEISVKSGQVGIRDPQVINGLQTLETLFESAKEGKSPERIDGVKVLVRLIDVGKEEYRLRGPKSLEERIAECSNTQNPILSRDLRSNDDIQKRLQSDFAAMGYSYERKRGQYPPKTHGVISNDKLAQRYLAFWLGETKAAKNELKAMCALVADGGHYEKVYYPKVSPEALLIPHLVYTLLPERPGFENDVVSHGDFVLLAMMGEVIREHFQITAETLTTSKREEGQQLVRFLGETSFQSRIKKAWKPLLDSATNYAQAQLEKRRKENPGKEPSVRNVFVGFNYKTDHTLIRKASTITAAAEQLG